MPLLRYNVAPTLNGLIASPSNSPADTTPWIVDDATIDFAALYAQFSAFIMGRKTYETFLALSPNPLAGRDKTSVVVFTRSPEKKRQWGEAVTIVDDDVVGFVKGLQQEQGKKDIWLIGGGEVAGLLMRARLVDTVEAAIMPVVATGASGGGMSMFGQGTEGKEGDGGRGWWRLELEELEKKETGIVMTRYRVKYD
ncbi:dihydrofolate reductase-like domain-containing protein [Chaetomidium leptoderma]|uniref:2,5-diamino-6-ribosylamino-4(3H)-pyrimidinone 5'-phosphate reductase n=1 Tax=Chaetomidium leptoderma TaxID=669021 RepID=A0AAN6ZWH3_9PEZI|nr:dihydrofolate reductase-like domain-containing protein [Chaetomidium leptoderma]